MQRSLRRPGAVQSYACQIVRSYAADSKVGATRQYGTQTAVVHTGMCGQMASGRPSDDATDSCLHSPCLTCRVQEDIHICRSLGSQLNHQFRVRLATMHIPQQQAQKPVTPAGLPVLPSPANWPQPQTLGTMHTHRQLVHHQEPNHPQHLRAEQRLPPKAQAQSQLQAMVPMHLKAKMPKQVKQAALQTSPLLLDHLLVKGRASPKSLQLTSQSVLQPLRIVKKLQVPPPPPHLRHRPLLVKGRDSQKALQDTNR